MSALRCHRTRAPACLTSRGRVYAQPEDAAMADCPGQAHRHPVVAHTLGMNLAEFHSGFAYDLHTLA
ncbi:MAG TPA: hypothetical protein VNY05_36245 [Candidatus Acidoferrales bacterium]|nr:hypothetical protein [Candidatus Acidoferrales bacterium]